MQHRPRRSAAPTEELIEVPSRRDRSRSTQEVRARRDGTRGDETGRMDGWDGWEGRGGEMETLEEDGTRSKQATASKLLAMASNLVEPQKQCGVATKA